MPNWSLDTWSNGLAAASSLAVPVILCAAVAHLILMSVLWRWYRRDLAQLGHLLDRFTQGIRHRSALDKATPVAVQVEAFLRDVNDVLNDPSREVDRVVCRERLNILDEQRDYLDKRSFDTVVNVSRTMIEAYPLAGVLGTILAIGAALQVDPAGEPSQAMAQIVSRFGDAIWSTFVGLTASIVLMFVNSWLEPSLNSLSEIRAQVRDMTAHAKRVLGMHMNAKRTSDGTVEMGSPEIQ